MIVAQRVNTFSAHYGNGRLIIVFVRTCKFEDGEMSIAYSTHGDINKCPQNVSWKA